MSDANRRLLLRARPEGLPQDDDFELAETELGEPEDGQVRVEVAYLSIDPAMRGWMRDVPSYLPPVGLGEVMRANGVGRVTASRHPDLPEGTFVSGVTGVQEHAVVDGRGVFPVDPDLARLPTYLGALGMTGLTAYFGLLDIGALQEGDTVVVSGAAGAVGSAVGQIAKIKGARAVGIAGGPEKCAHVVGELGFDACVDYKAGGVRRALKEHAPDGIDVYFDNVGGEILDAALTLLAMRARVVICGAISQYNEEQSRGPANYMSLLVKRARMEGFLVFDFAKRYGEATQEMAGWLQEGKLTAREDVVGGGIDAFAPALRRLFAGENTGKLVLEVAGG
jgi:NADPH-dependent curcumin reductase CurA